MSGSRKSSAEIAYAREIEMLAKYKILVNREDISMDEAKAGLKDLAKDFDRLLSDVKLLTSVGDRLQRKLKSANALMRKQSEEIQKINDDLQTTNVELKTTLDELSRARASRKAQTYILGIALILFLVSELVEEVFEGYFTGGGWDIAITWGVKVVLVLILQPIQSVMEKRMARAAMNEKSRELLDKHLGEEEGEAGAEGTTEAAPAATGAPTAAPTTAPTADDGALGDRPMSPKERIAAKKAAAARAEAERSGSAANS